MSDKARKILAVAGLVLAAGQALAQSAPSGPAPASTVTAAPADAAPVSLLAGAPSRTITNGLITAKIYLPGTGAFYHGTRFDNAGVIGSLVYRGREYYGPWFDQTSPELRDYVFAPDSIVGGPDSAASGPVEEYQTGGKALGFDEAAPGGSFVKIGVGVLKKPDAAPYDHYRHYEVIDAGKRAMTATPGSVSFTQDIADAGSGYSYHYVKTLRLVPGKAQMLIVHSLRNTGSKPIVTTVYDHNFLLLSPGNANIEITLPFAVASARPPSADIVSIAGNRIAYRRPLAGNDLVSFPISGFGTSAKDYDVRIVDTKTGFGMSITGDMPLESMNVWSIRTVMGLEPHLAMTIAPGEEKSWTYTYSYFGPGDAGTTQ